MPSGVLSYLIIPSLIELDGFSHHQFASGNRQPHKSGQGESADGSQNFETIKILIRQSHRFSLSGFAIHICAPQNLVRRISPLMQKHIPSFSSLFPNSYLLLANHLTCLFHIGHSIQELIDSDSDGVTFEAMTFCDKRNFSHDCTYTESAYVRFSIRRAFYVCKLLGQGMHSLRFPKAEPVVKGGFGGKRIFPLTGGIQRGGASPPLAHTL